MMKNSGSILKVLQLDTKIQHSEENDMNLEVEGYDLYIDEETTITNPLCVDCDLFPGANTNRQTILKYTIDHNGIAYFMQRDPNLDRYFFTFEVNDLNNSSTVPGVIKHITAFSTFEINQQYRLKVRYKVCGNNNLPSSYLSVNNSTFERSANITNEMWLIGTPLSFNSTKDKMPNTIAELLSVVPNPLSFNGAAGTTQVDQNNHANSFRFYCEFSGAFHTFYSTNLLNEIETNRVAGSTSCQSYYSTDAIVTFGKDYRKNLNNQVFPYEFKTPAFKPQEITHIAPSDYKLVKAEIVSYYFNSSFSPTFTNDITSYFNTILGCINNCNGCSSIVYNINDIINFYSTTATPINVECLQNGPINNNLLLGDESIRFRVVSYFEPCSCLVGSSNSITATDATVEFADNTTFGCQPVFSCGQIYPPVEINNSYLYGISTPNSNLQVTVNPTTTYNYSNQVCWNIDISNYTTSTNPALNNPATNLYLNAPFNNSSLNNWTLTLNGNNYPISTDLNHLNQFQIDDFFPNSQTSILSGQLCANYIGCPPTTNIYLDWGWNCGGYPTTPVNPSTVCSNSTTTLNVVNSPTRIEVDVLNQQSPASIPRCTNFTVTACFKSLDLGQFTPLTMNIANLANSGLTVLNVNLKNCNGGRSIPLVNGINGLYSLSQANLISIGLVNGIMNLNNCVCFEITFGNSCDFNGNIPNIELSGTSYCGINLSAVASFPIITLLNAGATCTNCSSFDKTISSTNIVNGVIPFGTSANYNFEICNYESSTMNYSISDIAPCFILDNPSALPINNIIIPAGQCSTLTVSGSFIQGCPTQPWPVVNTATLHNNTTGTNYTSSASVYVTNNCSLAGYTFFSGTTITAKQLLASPILAATNSTIWNHNIYISGDLLIDAFLDIQGCNIIMEAGKKIIIDGWQRLRIHSSTIKGCSNMWQGIRLNEYSELLLESNCLVQNAEKGIEVTNYTSQVKIVQTTFDNCIIGVDYNMPTYSFGSNSRFEIDECSFISSGNFLSDYVGQAPHGLIPYCGINFKNYDGNISNIGIAGRNYFSNLYRGVVAENSHTNINAATFENIKSDNFYNNPDNQQNSIYGSWAIMDFTGSGSLVTSNLNVDGKDVNLPVRIINCKNGIHTNASHSYINSVFMDNVEIGCKIENNNNYLKSDVQNCTINSNRYGILYLDNNGAAITNANANTIKITGKRPGIGISVNEIVPSGGDAAYHITYNGITSDAARAGIELINTQKAKVEFNYIVQKSSTGNFPTNSGIVLNDCKNGSVKCNNVENINANYTNSVGLVSNISEDNNIECNNNINNGTGIIFGGNNPNTNFIANEMKYNIAGLYLNSTAIIGQQNHNGNEWLNYTGGIGAYNANIGFEPQSQFYVHTSMGQISAGGIEYYPNLDITNYNNGWFNSQSGNPKSCTNQNGLNLCNSFIIGNPGNEYERLIALDSISSIVYENETRSQARMYLYNRLLVDSLLLISDAIFQTFLNTYASESIGELAVISNELSLQNVVTPAITTQLSNLANEEEQLYLLREQYLGNPATYYQVDLINVRLEQIAIQRQLILAGIKGDYQTRLDLANLLNQSTIPDVAPEENLQRMIEYFTKFKQEGIQSFIPSEITTLESIAHQCPFQGGPAVYIARALYKMINDSVEYNDDAVCLLDGIYRSGYDNINLNEFVLMPNPANESVQVAYINNEASIQSIKLIDIAGREIFNTTLNDPFRSYNLSTKALTSGIYRVIVESTYGSVSSKNLVVSH